MINCKRIKLELQGSEQKKCWIGYVDARANLHPSYLYMLKQIL